MQVSEIKIRPRLLNPKIRPLLFNLALSVLALGECIKLFVNTFVQNNLLSLSKKKSSNCQHVQKALRSDFLSLIVTGGSLAFFLKNSYALPKGSPRNME